MLETGIFFKGLCRISEIYPINLTALPIYNNNFPLSEMLEELPFFSYTKIQGFVWIPSRGFLQVCRWSSPLLVPFLLLCCGQQPPRSHCAYFHGTSVDYHWVPVYLMWWVPLHHWLLQPTLVSTQDPWSQAWFREVTHVSSENVDRIPEKFSAGSREGLWSTVHEMCGSIYACWILVALPSRFHVGPLFCLGSVHLQVVLPIYILYPCKVFKDFFSTIHAHWFHTAKNNDVTNVVFFKFIIDFFIKSVDYKIYSRKLWQGQKY
jgi:hypothetical protein